MKILALDLGDRWIGCALSDISQLLAKPYKTIPADQLTAFLEDLFKTQPIQTIIIGNPKTMKGTASQQTEKIHLTHQQLVTHFPEKTFILWDERLSSQRANNLKKAITKEEKIASHAIAAAFILESYLSFLQFQKI